MTGPDAPRAVRDPERHRRSGRAVMLAAARANPRTGGATPGGLAPTGLPNA